MKKNLLKSIFVIAFAAMTTAISAQERATIVRPIVDNDGANFENISPNGKWAVGFAFDNSDYAGYGVTPSIWNLETGERTILTPAEGGMAEAYCVNDEGTIVAGTYLNQPAYYQKGEWHTLEIPDGYTMGTVNAMSISGGNYIFVGYVQDNESAQSFAAAKWVNGKYERANPNSLRRDHMGEAANRNTCYSISEDGSTIMGSLNFTVRPNATPFIVTTDTAFTINLENESNKNLAHIFWPVMSPNGKYITGSYRHVIYKEGETQPSVDTYLPCLFEIETQRFQIFEKENIMDWGGYAVDNNGVVYANSPVETSAVRQGYVIKNGEIKDLETLLIENGVTNEAIDAASAPAIEEYNNKLGTIIAVSRDGKTIIGCAGDARDPKYKWVAKFDTEVSNTPISYDKLAAFYNNGTIVLSGMVDAIEVYNINGALIMNQNVESAFIDAQLENGIYIVKMYNNTTNTISTSKIIVK